MQRFVYITSFFVVASAGLVFVFLSELEEDFGVPGWGIGLVTSMGFLAPLVASLLLSPLADQGKITRLGSIALVAAVVGNVVFAFGTTLWVFVLGRGLAGIGIGLFLVVARKALIGSDTEDGGQILGQYFSVVVSGFLVGPALGAVLGRFGFEVPFLTLAAFIALCAFPTLRWIDGVRVATSSARIADMIPLIARPGVQAAIAGQVLIMGNVGVFDSVVDSYLQKDLGASNLTVALALLSVGLPLVLLPRYTGAFVDRVGQPGRIMVLALLFSVPAIAAFGVFGTILAFVLAGVVQGTVESVAFPAGQVVMLKETGAEELAIGQALLDSMGSLAAGITSIAAPLVFQRWGASAVFGGYSMIALGLTILAWGRVQSARRDGALRPEVLPVP